MGADVIKIEPPAHPTRSAPGDRPNSTDNASSGPSTPAIRDASRSTCARPADASCSLDLVERSDIIVENFRPGTLEKWNLGYDALRQRNRGIILVRVSGYGQTGPDAGKGGYASVAEAVSGLRHMNGFPGGPAAAARAVPRRHPGRDVRRPGCTGGAVPAHRHRRGQGRRRRPHRGLPGRAGVHHPDYDVGGVVAGRRERGWKALRRRTSIRSADGSWVVIAANQDTVFRRLCAGDGPAGSGVGSAVRRPRRTRSQSGRMDAIIGVGGSPPARTTSSTPSATRG